MCRSLNRLLLLPTGNGEQAFSFGTCNIVQRIDFAGLKGIDASDALRVGLLEGGNFRVDQLARSEFHSAVCRGSLGANELGYADEYSSRTRLKRDHEVPWYELEELRVKRILPPTNSR